MDKRCRSGVSRDLVPIARGWSRLTPLLQLALVGLTLAGGPARAQGWAYYGGDPGASRFSSLTQINRANVGELRQAWQWRHGDLARHPDRRGFAGFQATPILRRPRPARTWSRTPFNRIVASTQPPAPSAAFDPG
jgi:hypothetical protein